MENEVKKGLISFVPLEHPCYLQSLRSGDRNEENRENMADSLFPHIIAKMCLSPKVSMINRDCLYP